MRQTRYAMTIRELRILCTVEEQGGVKAAAHVLKMAEPAISQQLILLAKELGIALHRRVSRGIELRLPVILCGKQRRSFLSSNS